MGPAAVPTFPQTQGMEHPPPPQARVPTAACLMPPLSPAGCAAGLPGRQEPPTRPMHVAWVPQFVLCLGGGYGGVLRGTQCFGWARGPSEVHHIMRNRGWQCRIGRHRRKSSFSFMVSRRQRMPLSGRPLGFPPAWGKGDQREGPECHEVGWGSDVTWKRSSALGGTLILLGEAAPLLCPLRPVARKTPECSPPTLPHSVPPMPRGESCPRAGMASDFCYVATGQPGLG